MREATPARPIPRQWSYPYHRPRRHATLPTGTGRQPRPASNRTNRPWSLHSPSCKTAYSLAPTPVPGGLLAKRGQGPITFCV